MGVSGSSSADYAGEQYDVSPRGGTLSRDEGGFIADAEEAGSSVVNGPGLPASLRNARSSKRQRAHWPSRNYQLAAPVICLHEVQCHSLHNPFARVRDDRRFKAVMR